MSEIEFHWLESPLSWPYLRQSYLLTERPKGRPKIESGLLAGYADVDDMAQVGGAYRRRILYLESRDYPLDENSPYNPKYAEFTGWPSEAVDPLSVKLREPSRNISDITHVEAKRRVALSACSSLTSLA